MNRDEQIKFVKELTNTITIWLISDIEAGKTPETWDGIELRQFIADRYAASVFKGLLVGTRRREYNNTIRVNDL